MARGWRARLGKEKIVDLTEALAPASTRSHRKRSTPTTPCRRHLARAPRELSCIKAMVGARVDVARSQHRQFKLGPSRPLAELPLHPKRSHLRKTYVSLPLKFAPLESARLVFALGNPASIFGKYGLPSLTRPGQRQRADKQKEADESGEDRKHADAAHHAQVAHLEADPVVALEG